MADAEGREVAVVGGGPAGAATAVFTARAGLDTAVFDRGRSSLRQCAHLENYPGFPAGIDVETFYDLLHDHLETAGADLLAEMVTGVERADGGFRVETGEGRVVHARRVVAATRYDGEYLRGLDDEDAMFVESDGESYFDRSYADPDGTTPVEGLYVASPADPTSQQAIMAAGRGARVGRVVAGDARREAGYPDPFAERVDWLRRESARGGDERAHWREYWDENAPDDADEALREAEIEDRLDRYVTDADIERRRRAAHERILDHLDNDLIRAYLDERV
ncbi:MAG: FAD-dependent oxidoreductase [Halobacteriaceae archaeon]